MSTSKEKVLLPVVSTVENTKSQNVDSSSQPTTNPQPVEHNYATSKSSTGEQPSKDDNSEKNINNSIINEPECPRSENGIRVQCLDCQKIFTDSLSLWFHLNIKTKTPQIPTTNVPPIPTITTTTTTTATITAGNVNVPRRILPAPIQPIPPMGIPVPVLPGTLVTFRQPSPSSTVRTTPIPIRPRSVIQLKSPLSVKSQISNMHKLMEVKKNLDKAKVNKCNECNRRFLTPEHLDYHLQLVHLNMIKENNFNNRMEEEENRNDSQDNNDFNSMEHSSPINLLPDSDVEEIPPDSQNNDQRHSVSTLGRGRSRKQQLVSRDDNRQQQMVAMDCHQQLQQQEQFIVINYEQPQPEQQQQQQEPLKVQVIPVPPETFNLKSDKKYPCSCGKVFNNKKVRNMHAVKQGHDYDEEDELTLKCPICTTDPPSFATKTLFQKHVKSTHPTAKPFKCTVSPDCQKSFGFDFLLKKHVLNVHNIKTIYNCPIPECSKIFNNLVILRSHMKCHRPNQDKPKDKVLILHSCRLCSSSPEEEGTNNITQFPTIRLLKKHYINHHPGQRILPCPEPGCGQSCWTKYEMNAHRLFAHDDPSNYPHKCPECDKRFIYPYLLNDHLLRVHKKEFVICPICGVQCSSKIQYGRHKLAHNAIYQCHICPQNFNLRGNLKRHLDWHEGIKKFSCDVCLKGFHQKVQLEQHMSTVHSTEFNFPCTVPGCDKKFKAKPQLTSHLEYTHKIPSVKKRTIRPAGMCTDGGAKVKRVRPKKVKEPLRNVDCPECGKIFLGRHRLNLHITKIHRKGTIPCPKCDAMLATQFSLSAHLKVHEKYPPGTVFSCCGKRFTHQRFLTRHRIQVHGVNGGKGKSNNNNNKSPVKTVDLTSEEEEEEQEFDYSDSD